MKRLLKEPLLHFLVLGALIFVAHGLTSKRTRSEPGKIVITQGQIEHLAAGFAKVWQRPPSPEELVGLVRDRVREEVYCREALALGLDQDDTVIRRRLRQKMEFISDDIAARAEPTEEDLNAYLDAHPEQFRTEPRITFEQVYLNPEKHGDHLARDIAQLLAQLNQSGGNSDPAAMGDSFLLESQYTAMPAGDVARQFGDTFAAALAVLAPGQWQGPVESGYGVHLVRISERAEGTLPVLADVRDDVRREWENAQRLQANDLFYRELLKRYTVVIEGLEPADIDSKVVQAK